MFKAVALSLAVIACASTPTASTGTPTPTEPASTAPATTAPSQAPTATPTATASNAVSSLPTLDPSADGPEPSAVRFADAAHGWLGVADGLLTTIDGGSTWRRSLTSERIMRIWSVDGDHAWALAADNTVYRTQDAVHWSAMPPTDPRIVDIDFVTPLIGWAIASPAAAPPFGRSLQLVGTLLATTDGGAVWRPVTSLNLWSVCFSDERSGLGGSGKTIYRTSDAGRSWTKLADLTITDQGPWYPQLGCAGARDARVQVTEPYAALSHVPYLVFSTTDAGASWKLDYREGYTLGASTPVGTAGLGSYPSLMGTLPGLRTWIVTCSPPADAQTFLILDPSGKTLATRPVPFVSCARAASFVDDDHGWVIATHYQLIGFDVRSTGILVRTVDGARTWMLSYPR